LTPGGKAAHALIRRAQAQSREFREDTSSAEADEAFGGVPQANDTEEYEGFDSEDNGQYDSDYSDSELDDPAFPDQEYQGSRLVMARPTPWLMPPDLRERQMDCDSDDETADKEYDETTTLEDSTLNQESDPDDSDEESHSLSPQELTDILDTQIIIFSTEASIVMFDAVSLGPLSYEITGSQSRLLVDHKGHYRFFRTLEVFPLFLI
jgi:hypothetical protein